MAWTGITSFETTDGSTTPTDGNDIQATGDGTGWSGNWVDGGSATGKIVYDTGQSQDGSWSMMMDTFTAHVNLGPKVYRVLSSASTTGFIEYYVRCNVDDRDVPVTRLQSGTSSKIATQFVQTTTGTGRNVTVGGSTYSGVINIDTWYKIGIDYDCTTDTFDFYIDGIKKNGSALNFDVVSTTLDRFHFENNAASGFSSTLGNIFWIDNISDGNAITSDIKSIAGVAQADIKSIGGVANAAIKSIAGVSN